MSDERDNSRATASAGSDTEQASERSGPIFKPAMRPMQASELDVDALFDDLDEDPESVGSLTSGASRALTGGDSDADVATTGSGSPDSTVPRPDVGAKPAVSPEQDVALVADDRDEVPPDAPRVSTELRVDAKLDEGNDASLAATDDEDIDLEREALPAHSSGRQSLPPALRGAGIPAPPMSVPSLRPPAAAPPPLRASVPPSIAPPSRPSSPFSPPLHALAGAPSVPVSAEIGSSPALDSAAELISAPAVPSPAELAATPEAPPHAQSAPPPSVRTALPEAAPAPSLRSRATHETAQASPFVAIPMMSDEQTPANVTTKTLPSPVHQLRPSTKMDPLETIPLPLEREVPKKKQNRTLLLAGAGLVAVLLGVVAFLLSRPEPPGALVVSVSGPNAAAVPKLSVFVDEKVACSYSPCRVEGLEEGTHEVRAEAPGYLPGKPQLLVMHPGTDAIHNLVLSEKQRFATLKVDAQGEGLSILVDGKSLGAPPIELGQLTPGEHVVRVEGERFVSEDHTVTLEANENRHLGPFKPKVKTGSLTINPGTGADGAVVTLDGKVVPKLPATHALDGQKTHLLVAEKEGFDRFEHKVAFPDGRAELSVDVALLEAYEESPEEEEQTAADSTSSKPMPAKASSATLSMNSIPPSLVLLDGQRVGNTPRIGIRTKPGIHSVTFVHPQRGRKVKRVYVGAGQSKTVSVRF